MHNLKNVYRGSFGAHALIQCRQYATSRSKTYYNVLGVSKTATQKEIKSAYIDLSKKHHPDTAGSKSKKKFTEINEAYSVLSKPLSRKEYDNKIAFESSSSINYGPHGPKYRPPGSGPASYPPPGYRYGESYWQDDSAYTEYQRERSRYHSDLHWRYEYFYGEHGKENRERARASEAGDRSEEQQKKDLRRIVNGVLIAALIITILRFFAERQITTHRQFDVSRSPSDDMKRNINKTVLEEKDITPPVK